MKIRINEYESYDVNLDNDKELSVQEAFVLAERLLKVVKAVTKDDMMMAGLTHQLVSQRKTGSGKRGKSIWASDRNETLKLAKICYKGTREEKEAYANSFGTNWNVLMKDVYRFRKKWKIIPQEIGIERFYKRGEGQPRKIFISPANEKYKQLNSAVSSHKETSFRPFTKNREIALQVLYTHYWGTDEQKQALGVKLGIEWKKIVPSVSALLKKWNIKPKEVGLKAFPTIKNFGEFRRDKSKWKA